MADRWHLLQNLVNALEKTVTRHHSCLKVPATEPDASSAPADRSGEETPYECKIRERHRDVHELFGKGVGPTGSRHFLAWTPRPCGATHRRRPPSC